jgi:hypothetical protein
MTSSENHLVIPENHYLLELRGQENVRDIFVFPSALLNSTDVINISDFNPAEDLISLESDKPQPYWLFSHAGEEENSSCMLEIKYPDNEHGVLVIFEGLRDDESIQIKVKQHTSLPTPQTGYAPLEQL